MTNRPVIKRGVARHIDLTVVILLIDFLTPLDVYEHELAVYLLAHILIIPIEASVLYCFGNTLGKVVMGLKLNFQRGHRDFKQMLKRSWLVCFYGLGLGGPILSFILCVVNFNIVYDGGMTSWDLKCSSDVVKKNSESEEQFS
ncbi:RDD family protein [Aliikangiella sp. IMCC44632]